MEIESIEQLVEIIKNSKISELTVATDGTKVRLRKELNPAQPAPPRPAVQPVVKEPTSETPDAKSQLQEVKYITAPMVGIYHGNDEKLIGSKVHSGQVVGAIESMKLMNDILSDLNGIITEVLVEDGSPVEYGQSLFKVEPEA